MPAGKPPKIPDEPTPERKGRGAERAFSVRNYGMNTWGDLFNSRQKLALITFVEKVRQAYKEMIIGSTGFQPVNVNTVKKNKDACNKEVVITGKDACATELIDVLHSVLLHWEKSKRDEMIELLKNSEYGKSEAFYRVAQAISETLPNESKEKKLLDGFLAGKERLRDEITKEASMPKQKKWL